MIKRAKNESEVWRIISDINKPKSKATITLMENGKEISNEKEVGNLLNKRNKHFMYLLGTSRSKEAVE